MTRNFRKTVLTGTISLGIILGAMTPAVAMSVGEYYAFVKDCNGKGGRTGIHSDGSLGCKIGMAAVEIEGFKEALVPSKEQISKLSIKTLPTKMRVDTKAPQVLKSEKSVAGKISQ